jgi:membrane-associated phospholipid phosphatase
MPLVVLFAASMTAGIAAGLLTSRFPRAARPSITAADRAAGRRRAADAELDPEEATGIALSFAVPVVVAGGAALGMLAVLVRSDTGLERLDAGVARWGDRHGTAFTTDVIRIITDAGAPRTIAVLAIVLGSALLLRTRKASVALFLLAVVGGNAIVTTAVKDLVDRVRPSLNPIAETLGPSFPSGHSSHTAAFLAAAALLLGRGRGRRTRALLAGVAVGLAVAVASSRVLLDEHWLSDVVAGLALGWAWFAVCAIAFGGRLLQFGAKARQMGARDDPRVAAAPPPRTPERSA